MRKLVIVLVGFILLNACSSVVEQETENTVVEGDSSIIENTTAKESIEIESEKNEEEVEPASKETIITFFQAYLKSDVCDVILEDYSLVKVGAKWKIKTPLDDVLDFIIDYKNGYIEITDEGTGGGTVFVQFVLFRLADESPLLAYSRVAGDDIDVYISNEFYKFSDAVFEEYTFELFEGLEFYDRLELDKVDSKLINKNMKLLPTCMKLPRYGTTVFWDVITSVLTARLMFEPENKDYLQLKDYLDKGLIKKSMPLEWDKKTGTFSWDNRFNQ